MARIWREWKHPRDTNGRFAEKGSAKWAERAFKAAEAAGVKGDKTLSASAFSMHQGGGSGPGRMEAFSMTFGGGAKKAAPSAPAGRHKVREMSVKGKPMHYVVDTKTGQDVGRFRDKGSADAMAQRLDKQRAVEVQQADAAVAKAATVRTPQKIEERYRRAADLVARLDGDNLNDRESRAAHDELAKARAEREAAIAAGVIKAPASKPGRGRIPLSTKQSVNARENAAAALAPRPHLPTKEDRRQENLMHGAGTAMREDLAKVKPLAASGKVTPRPKREPVFRPNVDTSRDSGQAGGMSTTTPAVPGADTAALKRPGARKGDLAIVERTSRSYVIGKPTEERTEVHVGVVTSTDKDGRITGYSTSADGSYPQKVDNVREKVLKLEAERVDVPAAIEAAKQNEWSPGKPGKPLDSVEHAKEVVKPFLGDQRDKLKAARAAAPRGRDPMRLQPGDRILYSGGQRRGEGAQLDVIGEPETFSEFGREKTRVRVRAEDGREGYVSFMKSEKAQVLPAAAKAETSSAEAPQAAAPSPTRGRIGADVKQAVAAREGRTVTGVDMTDPNRWGGDRRTQFTQGVEREINGYGGTNLLDDQQKKEWRAALDEFQRIPSWETARLDAAARKIQVFRDENQALQDDFTASRKRLTAAAAGKAVDKEQFAKDEAKAVKKANGIPGDAAIKQLPAGQRHLAESIVFDAKNVGRITAAAKNNKTTGALLRDELARADLHPRTRTETQKLLDSLQHMASDEGVAQMSAELQHKIDVWNAVKQAKAEGVTGDAKGGYDFEVMPGGKLTRGHADELTLLGRQDGHALANRAAEILRGEEPKKPALQQVADSIAAQRDLTPSGGNNAAGLAQARAAERPSSMESIKEINAFAAGGRTPTPYDNMGRAELVSLSTAAGLPVRGRNNTRLADALHAADQKKKATRAKALNPSGVGEPSSQHEKHTGDGGMARQAALNEGVTALRAKMAEQKAEPQRHQTFAERMAGDMSESDRLAANLRREEQSRKLREAEAERARQVAEAEANDTRSEREKLTEQLQQQRDADHFDRRSGRTNPQRIARIKAMENRLEELNVEDRKAKIKALDIQKGDKVTTRLGEFEITGKTSDGYLRVVRADGSGRRGSVNPDHVEAVTKAPKAEAVREAAPVGRRLADGEINPNAEARRIRVKRDEGGTLTPAERELLTAWDGRQQYANPGLHDPEMIRLAQQSAKAPTVWIDKATGREVTNPGQVGIVRGDIVKADSEAGKAALAAREARGAEFKARNAGNLEKAREVQRAMTREQLIASTDPKDNGAKIRAMQAGNLDRATLYKTANAGPSGQRTHAVVGRIEHTPDNSNGEYRVRSRDGETIGWISSTTRNGKQVYSVHSQNANDEQRLEGWSGELSTAADVLTNGEFVARGYGADARRASSGTFERYAGRNMPLDELELHAARDQLRIAKERAANPNLAPYARQSADREVAHRQRLLDELLAERQGEVATQAAPETPKLTEREAKIAAKEAELEAARRRLQAAGEYQAGGSSKRKQFAVRMDGALRRAGQARNDIVRLENELKALRNPKPEAPKVGPVNFDDIKPGGIIKRDGQYYRVVKVNPKSVKVEMPPGWDDVFKKDAKITEVHAPGLKVTKAGAVPEAPKAPEAPARGRFDRTLKGTALSKLDTSRDKSQTGGVSKSPATTGANMSKAQEYTRGEIRSGVAGTALERFERNGEGSVDLDTLKSVRDNERAPEGMRRAARAEIARRGEAANKGVAQAPRFTGEHPTSWDQVKPGDVVTIHDSRFQVTAVKESGLTYDTPGNSEAYRQRMREHRIVEGFYINKDGTPGKRGNGSIVEGAPGGRGAKPYVHLDGISPDALPVRRPTRPMGPEAAARPRTGTWKGDIPKTAAGKTDLRDKAFSNHITSLTLAVNTSDQAKAFGFESQPDRPAQVGDEVMVNTFGMLRRGVVTHTTRDGLGTTRVAYATPSGGYAQETSTMGSRVLHLVNESDRPREDRSALLPKVTPEVRPRLTEADRAAAKEARKAEDKARQAASDQRFFDEKVDGIKKALSGGAHADNPAWHLEMTTEKALVWLARKLGVKIENRRQDSIFGPRPRNREEIDKIRQDIVAKIRGDLGKA